MNAVSRPAIVVIIAITLASSSAATGISAGSSRTEGSTRVPLRSKKTHIARILSEPMTAIADLPGPAGLPGLGNALQLRPERLHLMIERWGRRYGPVFRFAMGPREVVGFTDPETVNAILRERPHGYRRWREVEAVANEIGVIGPFTSEGEDWKRQRRLAVTALNTNHLRRYFDVIRVATDRLHTRLAAKDEAAILDDFMSYSVDVTSALAFGHDLNTLEHGDGELQVHIANVFELLARRILSPVPYWHVFKPPADRAAERSLEVIKGEIAGFIAQARRRMEERPELREAPENFLESMLANARVQRARRDRQRLHDAVRRRGHDRQHAGLGDVAARAGPAPPARGCRPRPTRSWARRARRARPRPSTAWSSPRPCSARPRG